jgi:uncharacterized transporter YbjL
MKTCKDKYPPGLNMEEAVNCGYMPTPPDEKRIAAALEYAKECLARKSKKTLNKYLNQNTERSTFIPVDSKAIGKTIQEIEAYGVKVGYYHPSPKEIDVKVKPLPDTKLYVGMGIQLIGKRKKIKNLCEVLDLP